jgi:hypothetical protein
MEQRILQLLILGNERVYAGHLEVSFLHVDGGLVSRKRTALMRVR